ncbi:MAG: hypothetical protein ACQESE_00795 [Nanobdellota archaeon]
MKIDHTKLKEKGWSDEEIEHAKEVFEKAEENKHPHMKALERGTYWMLLIIIIGGAIGGAYLMEPLLIAMNKIQAIASILILGGLFGSLASVLVKDIEHAQVHHHIIISAVIPVSSIITSIIITHNVRTLKDIFTTIANHNPYILGVSFAIAALIPYSIFTIQEHKRSQQKTKQPDSEGKEEEKQDEA